jgi:hypothetical protein
MASAGEFKQENASSLVEIQIPESVKRINDRCFCDNFSLQTINLPSQLERIGVRAFGYSDATGYINLAPQGAVTELQINIDSLPDSIAEIGSYAFYSAGDNVRIANLPVNLEVLNEITF